MLALLLALLLTLVSNDAKLFGEAAAGFCTNHVPELLIGTGFAAVSDLTKEQCETEHGKHSWCPLSDETRKYEVGNTVVEFYFYSACCMGVQGSNLLVDSATGLPTCLPGRSASKCFKHHWEHKIMLDLGIAGKRYPADHEYYYNYQVSPSEVAMNHSIVGGGREERANCICSAQSPQCRKRSEDQSTCLHCFDVDEKCNDFAAIRFGLHFFKLHSIDLKSSLLAFSGWIRQEWHDSRLTFNHQCYGGLDKFDVLAEAGSLENSRIWTPDIELLNNEEPIWQGNIAARPATVYACSGSAPSRNCGYVWWSRPGIVKALCKYAGLVRFPLDELRCDLEFVSWASDGRYLDILPRATDSGVSWSGNPDSHTMEGVTGGSQFQDYTIKDINVRRDIAMYNCCPDAPFPTLIYTVKFERSTQYYMWKLIVPAIGLTIISFGAFFMHPESGERVGFGIGTIVAVIMQDVVAASLMPIANESLLMDYISRICLLFVLLSMLETCFVINLYHRTDMVWYHAIFPKGSLLFLLELKRRWNLRGRPKRSCSNFSLQQPKDMDGLMKLQLYKEVFHTLDKDATGELDIFELGNFALAMSGESWHTSSVLSFLEESDRDLNSRVSFNEFVAYCDCTCSHLTSDLATFRRLAQGFLRTIDRRNAAISSKWKGRAATCDNIARLSVPFGFAISLGILFTLSEEDLHQIMKPEQMPAQLWLLLHGYIPLAAVTVIYMVFKVYWLYQKAKRAPSDEHNEWQSFASRYTGSSSNKSRGGVSRPKSRGGVSQTSTRDTGDVLRSCASSSWNSNGSLNVDTEDMAQADTTGLSQQYSPASLTSDIERNIEQYSPTSLTADIERDVEGDAMHKPLKSSCSPHGLSGSLSVDLEDFRLSESLSAYIKGTPERRSHKEILDGNAV